jgi:hypothetical protein
MAAKRTGCGMKTSGWLVRAAGVATVTVAIAGCSSSSKSSSSASSSSASSNTTSGSGSGGASSQISSIATAINGAKNATFKAVYTETAGGTTQTVTLEQAPPNSLFASGGSRVITTASGTFACQTGAGCTALPAGVPNPSAALAAAFSPSAALTAIQAAANQPGVTVDSETFAGQASTCVSYSAAGQTAKYCVTNSGVLASESTTGVSFTLTTYTATVPASDFATS